MRAVGGRVGALLLLIGLGFALQSPAAAQQEDSRIQPLNVDPDINGVDMITGEAFPNVPVLQIPAAPNLRLGRLDHLVPFFQGTVTSVDEGGQGTFSANHGTATSDSFTCQPVCIDDNRSGASLNLGLHYVGGSIEGHVSYWEGASGKVILFNQPITDTPTGPPTTSLARYAGGVTYANGEGLSFAYDQISGSGTTVHRPVKVTSNLGYVMTLTYRNNNILSPGSTLLREAAIYAADDEDFSDPLARHTYGNDGSITDLAGRVWSCCADGLTVDATVSQMAIELPGMTVDSFVAEAESRTYQTSHGPVTTDLWVTEYTSDGVVYEYSYEADTFEGSPTKWDLFITRVDVSGPLGYSRQVEIEKANERAKPVITRITDALGRQTNYEYGQYSRLERIVYPEGNAVSVEYDNLGNITARRVESKVATDPDLVGRAGFPAACELLLASTDILCFRPIWTEDAAGHRTDYTWESHGGMRTRLEPVDENGRRRKTIYAYEAHIIAPGADPIYRLIRERVCSTNAAGAELTCGTQEETRTVYAYWEDTFLPETVIQTNGTALPRAVTRYIYDPAGRALSEEGPLGGTEHTSFYRYDAAGRRTWEIAPVGEAGTRRAATVTSYRDADDQPLSVEAGYVITEASQNIVSGTLTTNIYNDRRLVTRTELSGGGATHGVTQHQYDARNRRYCSAVRMNPGEFGSLPANACNLDAEGSFGPDRIRRTSFDALSRPTQVLGGYRVMNGGAGNIEIAIGYTLNGQIEWREDGNRNRTSYLYDGYNRPHRTTFPDGSYEQVNTYDPRGLVLQLRNRRGQTISHDYDDTGRRIETSYSTADPDILYDYDGIGRETEVERPGVSTISYSYDNLGRRDEVDQDGQLIRYEYDLAGRRTKLTWPDNYHITYEYTPAGQLTRILEGGASELIRYDYDGYGRMVRINRTNDIDTTFSYDAAFRLETLDQLGNVAFDLGYNPASQIIERTISNDAYVFDEADLDALGYDVNNLNQYDEVDGVDFSYDLSGNLTDDGPNSYSYDPENRMTGASGPALAAVMKYDGRGRLRWAATDAQGTLGTRYLYDGDALIALYDPATGTLRSRVIHGAGVDDPLFEDNALYGRRYFYADERGSIVGLTGENAPAINQQNSYDDWGVPASGNQGTLQYTGQLWNPYVRMYYYKARLYNPGLGRFMQTDPIGYEDGMNMYAYVGNDPINGLDPSGLQSCPASSACPDVVLPARSHRDALARALGPSRMGQRERGAHRVVNLSTGEVRDVTGRAAGRPIGSDFQHTLTTRPGEQVILISHTHNASGARGVRGLAETASNNGPSEADQLAMHQSGVAIQLVGPSVTGTLYRTNEQDYFLIDSGDVANVPDLQAQDVEVVPSSEDQSNLGIGGPTVQGEWGGGMITGARGCEFRTGCN